jgi:ATP-dependent HslUV protease ATP-binding subunit HslU
MSLFAENMTPAQIVAELDKYIIGQKKAKKAVAIALRNRTRRQKLEGELRDEVAPKNIIMIGPTGVGKTEIARRLAKLCGAPFLKVEATKYTEVGYVGRDVESMVRDLMKIGISMVKKELQEEVRTEASVRATEAVLDLLLPGTAKKEGEEENPTRAKFRQMLATGELNDKTVEISVTSAGNPQIEIFSGTAMEDMDLNIGSLGNIFGGKKKKKKVSVSQAVEILTAEEMDKLVDMDKISDIARERVQETGIIFLDEIDKIASREGRGGADVSREGVQRDILPIVEGSKVNTKFGIVDTSHILFIAAGAFHMSKPSDLIPELQGRFPIRVELDALTEDDFYSILTTPQNALTKQYVALMETEEVHINFKDEAIRRISQIAAQVNGKNENIGARRLHTIMELLLEEVSFHGPELTGQTIDVTRDYVDERLQAVLVDQDLSRFIL